MKKQAFLTMGAFCLLISLAACRLTGEETLANPRSGLPEDSVFVHFAVQELFEQLQAAGKNSPQTIELANGSDRPWQAIVWEDNFLSEGFTAGDQDHVVWHRGDLLSLRGHLAGDADSEVSLLLTRGLLAGSIRMGTKTCRLEPVLSATQRGMQGYSLVPEPLHAESSGVCGWQGDADTDLPEGLPEAVRVGASCSRVEIRANGDFEFFRDRAGSDLNFAVFGIAATLHQASQRFAYVGNKLGLQGVVVYTNSAPPFYYPTSWNIYELAEQTRNAHNFYYPNPSWDAVVLFTGKLTLPSGVTGIPYQRGVVCRYNDTRSFAVVRVGWSGSHNVNITAHNVAHLLGASHTTDFAEVTGCRNNSIMQPTVPLGSGAVFTLCTRDEMLFYRWFHHDCMDAAPCD